MGIQVLGVCRRSSYFWLANRMNKTMYQYQDNVDDVKIGMKSLTITCGRHTIPTCCVTTVGFVALMS